MLRSQCRFVSATLKRFQSWVNWNSFLRLYKVSGIWNIVADTLTSKEFHVNRIQNLYHLILACAANYNYYVRYYQKNTHVRTTVHIGNIVNLWAAKHVSYANHSGRKTFATSPKTILSAKIKGEICFVPTDPLWQRNSLIAIFLVEFKRCRKLSVIHGIYSYINSSTCYIHIINWVVCKWFRVECLCW